jgi:hypothetical protein
MGSLRRALRRAYRNGLARQVANPEGAVVRQTHDYAESRDRDGCIRQELAAGVIRPRTL